MDQSIVMKRDTTHETAFEALYEAHANRLTRYIAARVGTQQTAEDLAAQTFLKALEGMRLGRGVRNQTAWLFGIARHVVADHYRQQRKTLPLEAAVAVESNTLFERVDQQMLLEQVAAALEKLSPLRAEALALRIFGGLTTKEAARVMRRSPRAVKMLVYRGVQDLQNLFKGGR